MEPESLHQAAAEAEAHMDHDVVHELFYQDPKFWVFVAFVIFIALAAKYIWPMIGRSLDKRAENIKEQLEAAARLQAEAEALLASYQREQTQAKRDAEMIVENAKRDAESIHTKAADELQQTIARRTAQAEESIARAKADALAQIRLQLVDAATAQARTVLAEQLTGQKDDPALSRALSAIETQLH